MTADAEIEAAARAKVDVTKDEASLRSIAAPEAPPPMRKTILIAATAAHIMAGTANAHPEWWYEQNAYEALCHLPRCDCRVPSQLDAQNESREGVWPSTHGSPEDLKYLDWLACMAPAAWPASLRATSEHRIFST